MYFGSNMNAFNDILYEIFFLLQYQGDHRPHCSHEQHLNEVIYKISGNVIL